MKKLFFCFSAFLLFCLLPQTSFAQKCSSSSASCENKKLHIGVSVGPTVDWFSSTSKDFSRKNVKGGMIAGVNLDINLPVVKMFYFTTGLFVRYLQADMEYMKEHDFSGILPDTAHMLKARTITTFQTTYLTIPTGLKIRTTPIKNCVFVGKLGLYHNFKIGGKQFDSFKLENTIPDKFLVSTPKIANDAAAIFAESAYLGLGFEYGLKSNLRIFVNVDYSCQFNYFSTKNSTAKNNITKDRFKSVVHSLQLALGVLF